MLLDKQLQAELHIIRELIYFKHYPFSGYSFHRNLEDALFFFTLCHKYTTHPCYYVILKKRPYNEIL